MKMNEIYAKVITYFVLMLFVAISLAPCFMIFMSAFKENIQIFKNPYLPGKELSLSPIIETWTRGRMGIYWKNSVIVTLPTVLSVVLISSLAGYAFAKLKFIENKLLFYFFLIGLMVPFQALIIPLHYDLIKYNLINTYHGLILVQISVGLPFGIFLMRSFFRSLPDELIQAAKIDGASEFKVFMFIVAPLVKPAALTLSIFSFLGTWNEFLLALIILHDEPMRTLPLGIMFFQGAHTMHHNLIAAAALISSLPVIILYLFLQRYFIKGMTAMGALKG